jgi:predicted DNA-binding transcriptional regulator YafY
MLNDAIHALERQWTLLRSIPRYPQSITTTALVAILRDNGHTQTRRTVERDLVELIVRFPLQLDDSRRPFKWSWMKDANLEFMPRLTTSQAVAIKLVQVHARNMIPLSMLEELEPMFQAAEKELANTGWKDWHARFAVVPPMFVQQPPTIDPDILADVHEALARRLCLTVDYKSRDKPRNSLRVHPLGMLFRGNLQYLVCTIEDFGKLRQLALQRMSSSAVHKQPCDELAGFDINAYAATGLAIKSEGPIRLRLRFEARAADLLRECPMSKDQKCTAVEGSDRIDVTGTVENDQQLRWWLLQFGCQVEVMKPVALRREMGEELRKAAGRYGVVA